MQVIIGRGEGEQRGKGRGGRGTRGERGGEQRGKGRGREQREKGRGGEQRGKGRGGEQRGRSFIIVMCCCIGSLARSDSGGVHRPTSPLLGQEEGHPWAQQGERKTGILCMNVLLALRVYMY